MLFPGQRALCSNEPVSAGGDHAAGESLTEASCMNETNGLCLKRVNEAVFVVVPETSASLCVCARHCRLEGREARFSVPRFHKQGQRRGVNMQTVPRDLVESVP